MNSEARSGGAGPKRKRGPSHEGRVLLATLASGLPGAAVSLSLLWMGGYGAKVSWTLTALVVCCWLGFSLSVRSRVVRPLQTISNLLAALREGDYSVRARGAGDDALGEVMREVNALGEMLRRQRLGAMEATALLRTVMAEIDVAVFAFDEEGRLRLVNRAGERLLAQPAERLEGRTAAELRLSDCLDDVGDSGLAPRVVRKSFAGSQNLRWGVRRNVFRQHGRPHRLLVLEDLSRPLREEEARAWQRLVRVLGHELNNSLAPIKSIAGSLSSLVAREPRPADWQEDVRRGLGVVSSRAESLSRFMDAYARLARLPPPSLRTVELGALLRRVVELQGPNQVELVAGPELTLRADPDQIEQLLINVIRNASEAASATGGSVRAGWAKRGRQAEVWVEDEGLGLASDANLFVPFFTTKEHGSGIGLVLSRQIAEAHGGTLTLENRSDRQGCVARLHLPLGQ